MKKAQATPVATFIIIMALFILAFVLLLPEEDRQALLDETSDSDSDDDDDVTLSGQKNLLYVSPGEVVPFERNELTKNINPVRIYSKTEDEVMNLADRLKFSRNLMNDNPQTITFQLDDAEDIEDLKLIFFVNSGSGDAYITVNGHTVFEGDITSGDTPITVSPLYVRTNNIIKFGLKSGPLFTKSYELSSVSMKYSSRDEQLSELKSFEITGSERAGMSKATMSYFVNCLKIKGDQGILTIQLNGRQIATEHVICDAGLLKQSLRVADLRAGTNSLKFSIDKGDYQVEGIEIEMKTSESYYPRYNFELGDAEYDDIKDNEIDAFLHLKFPNDDDRKEASITVNEYQVNMKTSDDEYLREISSYLERGTNYVKVVPKIDFDITTLRVYLEDEEE